MKTAKRLPLSLLNLIIIHHVFLANSASFEGPVFSGRMLRKLPSPPPAPQLGHAPHYKLFNPPPPPPPPPPPLSSLQMRTTAPNLRTVSVRKRSPPAPKPSRPRNFRSFLPTPPPPPSKCNIAPPPPESF